MPRGTSTPSPIPFIVLTVFLAGFFIATAPKPKGEELEHKATVKINPDDTISIIRDGKETIYHKHP